MNPVVLDGNWRYMCELIVSNKYSERNLAINVCCVYMCMYMYTYILHPVH